MPSVPRHSEGHIASRRTSLTEDAERAGEDSRLSQLMDHVRSTINSATDIDDHRDVLLQLMARRGRVLAPGGTPKFPIFVFDFADVLGGPVDAAILAAAAVEFSIVATDVVDDLVDEEWEGDVPEHQALNATLTLTALSQLTCHQLAPLLGAPRAQVVSGRIIDGLICASSGEHMDLVFETRDDVSEEAALAMTERKSGSLVSMACEVGAALATDDPKVLALAGQFGRHVGVVAQLLNDLSGVMPDASSPRGDLRRRKKTLPIAYALQCADEERLPTLRTWLESTDSQTPQQEDDLAILIRDLGGLHFTWTVADFHLREASLALRRLQRLTKGPRVSELRRLIPKVHAKRISATR